MPTQAQDHPLRSFASPFPHHAFGYQKVEGRKASGTMYVPASCTLQNGIQLSCGGFALLAKQVTGSSILSIQCSGSSDCTCPVTMDFGTSTESGTYTVQSTQITTTPVGQTSDAPQAYCVAGKQITIETTESYAGVSSHGSMVLVAQ